MDNGTTALIDRPIVPSLPPSTIEGVQTEAGALALPILSTATSLVVADNSSYEIADDTLGKIRAARKSVEKMIADKIDGIIKPIRTGLDVLYETRRKLIADLDGPLERLEKRLKQQMADYQTQLLIERQRVEDERRREEDRLRREAQAAERAAAQARTAEEKARLTVQAQVTQSALDTAQSQIIRVPQAPAASASSVKKIQRAKITDHMKLLRAIVEEDIPDGVVTIMINEDAVLGFVKQDADLAAEWERYGVEVYTEIAVTGRGGRGGRR